MVNNLLFMKQLILMFFFLTSLAVTSWSQEAKKIQAIENKTVKIQPNKTSYSNHDADQVSKDKEPKIILTLSSKDNSSENVTEEKLTPEQIQKIDEEIKAKNSLIEAIDKKIDIVKNNPIEDKKAQETGWYAQMEESKKSALNDIEKLNALKNK